MVSRSDAHSGNHMSLVTGQFSYVICGTEEHPMQHQRVLVAVGIAWLTALSLIWLVYKRTTAPQSRDLVLVAAAAQDLATGKRIQTDDLKLIMRDRKDFPRGAFVKTSDVVDRSVATPIASGEIVMNGKLAAKGSGEGLTALIEPGMRAVSV